MTNFTWLPDGKKMVNGKVVSDKQFDDSMDRWTGKKKKRVKQNLSARNKDGSFKGEAFCK